MLTGVVARHGDCTYSVEDTLKIPCDVLILEPKHAVALGLELSGPPGIVLYLLVVGRSVYLQDQLRLRAEEIHNEPADRMLPAELQIAVSSASEMLPQKSLRRSLRLSQLASPAPNACRRPYPLPTFIRHLPVLHTPLPRPVG